MMKYLFIIMLIVLAVPVSATNTSGLLLQPWCGTPTVYFSHASVPDIAGYEGLKIYPDGSPQADENVTVKNTLGRVLVDSYVSGQNLPNVATIRAGVWQFHTYHYVSLATGTTDFNFTVFKRSSSGTETYLFSTITEDINALTATEYQTSYVVQNDTVMLPTDRIVIKVYAESTHSSNVVAHFLYEGTTNTSHVVPSLFVCNQVASPQIKADTGADVGSMAVVGVIGGLLGAIAISRRKQKL